MHFDGLSLCFNGKYCCLCAEFYSLNGTSIMESIVLRSEDLLRFQALLPESVSGEDNEECYHFSMIYNTCGEHEKSTKMKTYKVTSGKSTC